MELDWIADFLALAETGVFSKAAMRRNVTQPAFTRRIRKLEYALGATLFDRSVHPVTLTAAGEEFRPTAIEIIRQIGQAKSRLRSLTGAEDMVAIASLQALASSFLPPWLGALYRGRRPPAIKVLAEDFAGCVEALLTGSADLMLTYSHPAITTAELEGRFAACPVGEDRLVAVCGTTPEGLPQHDLSDPHLPYLRYSGESFLGKVVGHILETQPDLSERLVPKYQNSMADGLKSAARAGLGLAWLPLRLAEEDLALGRLARISSPEAEARIDITLFREEGPKSRQVERLWSEITRRAGHDGGGATAPPA